MTDAPDLRNYALAFICGVIALGGGVVMSVLAWLLDNSAGLFIGSLFMAAGSCAIALSLLGAERRMSRHD